MASSRVRNNLLTVYPGLTMKYGMRNTPRVTRALLFLACGYIEAFQYHIGIDFCRPQSYGVEVPSTRVLNKVRYSTFTSRRRCKNYSRPNQSLPFMILSTSAAIEGLIPQPTFDRLNCVDEVVRELRTQIPSLLSVPLAEQQASKIFIADTRLTVGDSFELTSGFMELILISNAIVLAATASARAGAFFSSFGQQSRQLKDPLVHCQIALVLDPTGDDTFVTSKIKVLWEANLLPGQEELVSDATSKVKGVSLLTLDPETAKVAEHQLLSVFWNGSYLDPMAIGQSLVTLRRTVKGFQDSPFLQPFLTSASSQTSALAIFNQVRDDLILQSEDKITPLAPLYVALENATKVHRNATDVDELAMWIPIDDFKKDKTMPFPLPGSTHWWDFASFHRGVTHFVKVVVPALSTCDEDISNLFTPDARLVTLDGSILLKGAGRVANFYASLAALRRRTFGTWTLAKVAVTEWKTDEQCNVKIAVDYSTNLNAPGVASTAVRGKDIYILSSANDSFGELVIDEIQQKEFVIGDNSNPVDGVWFLRSMATAIDSGRSPSADGFWMDLLQRATKASDSRRVIKNGSNQPLKQPKHRPIRSDDAALTTYRIMETLLQDCPKLVSTDGMDMINRGPASQYMAENVQLKGYLGESLLRGRLNYNQIFVLVLASFQATLRSGNVVSEKEPLLRVELTPKGNVICSITLFLKLLPPLMTGFAVGKSTASTGTIARTSMPPLKIGLLSEYVLCPVTGKILQHRLLESRINGQLTPGDLMSRWIQRLAVGAEVTAEKDDNAIDWIHILHSTMEWLRFRNSNTS